MHQYKVTEVYQQSPGYLTHLEGVAKAAKYIKWDGYVGIAVGGSASAVKVQNVCAKGDVEACEKIKYTETGAFVGGVVVGGAASTVLAKVAAGSICLALGVPSGGLGTIACGIVLVGGSSYIAGKIGEKGGEEMGEFIYGVAN